LQTSEPVKLPVSSVFLTHSRGDLMEWVAIITAIIEMIQQCKENREEDEIIADALNRPVGRWMIRAHLKSKGIRGRKLAGAMRDVRSHKMTDKDIEAFVSNAIAGKS